MQTINIEDLKERVSEIIDQLAPGEEVVIARGNQPVARLVGEECRPRPVPGRCKGMLTILVEDEDHLQDWAEYLP